MASQGAGQSFERTGPRATAYAANQHSVSIIGTDIGRAYLPENFAKPEQARNPPALKESFKSQLGLSENENVLMRSP